MKRLVLAPSSVGVTNTLFSRRSTVKALRFPTATIVTASDSSMTVRWSLAVSTRRTFVGSGFWVSSFCAIKPSVIVAAATEIVRNDFIWLVPPRLFRRGQEPQFRRTVIPDQPGLVIERALPTTLPTEFAAIRELRFPLRIS